MAVNALWPHSVIATAAISNVLAGEAALAYCPGTPDHGGRCSGHPGQELPRIHRQLLIDDVFLAEEGVTDFSVYRGGCRQAFVERLFCSRGYARD
ncbi:MAG: hypothetical protein Ct9H300mP16_14800 [Pseudomonadota bacterium]|nr:MAG: hypothetical protein Ct9H300mP16_14800 [Pseudomonadota bacterium]